MDHPQGVLRTGDRATVRFEFISQPEFVKEGMKLLFREGKTKVLRIAIPLHILLTVVIGAWSNNSAFVDRFVSLTDITCIWLHTTVRYTTM